MIEDDGADKPLDPALDRIRRKMIRLLAVSIAVLFVGLIAVLSAVVYRSSGRAPAAAGASAGLSEGTSAPISIQAGARVVETDVDSNHAMLRITLADGTEELILIDLSSGAVVSRYPIRVEGGSGPAAPPPAR